jgi:hypothetical protein
MRGKGKTVSVANGRVTWRLYVQRGPDWTEAEVLDWGTKRRGTQDRIYVKIPDSLCSRDDIVVLDRRELWEKRRTSYDGYTFFTPDGKEREDAANATTIAAGQMAEELYVYFRDHESITVWRWDKERIFNMNDRWLFFCRDGDKSDLMWVEREGFDSHEGARAHDGYGDGGTVYSEAGMRAWMKRDEERHRAPILAEDAITLHVSVNCTEAEVIAAFKRLAKVHHPDTGGTAEAFRKISQARDRALATLTARKKAA